MQNLKATSAVSLLPRQLQDEIIRLFGREGVGGLNEIRIRRQGRCSVLHGGRLITLRYSPSARQTEEILSGMLGGALYSHRDSIASGYISLAGGVRVGVVGNARYEDGRLVGVSDIRSLIIRIPTGVCHFASHIHSIYTERAGRGMLIYSPPGVGKTTALRSLAYTLGGGKTPIRVAVIDERREFDESEYRECEVDILRGYKRRAGIEIAVSVTAPEVIIVDEIGGEDTSALASAMRCGVPVIAATHGRSLKEIRTKPSLREIMSLGIFDTFVGISKGEDGYKLTVDKE